jgi:hypothetical protein
VKRWTVTRFENTEDHLRVMAVDKQGNKRISPVRLVSVPLDDLDALRRQSPGGDVDVRLDDR